MIGVVVGDEEKEAHVRGDFDLGVEVGGFELGSAGEQGVFELGGVLNGGAEGGGAQAVEGGGAGVKDDETMGGEEMGDEAGEGAAEGLAGGVELAKEVGFGSEVEELGEMIEDGGDFGGEGDLAYRLGAGWFEAGVKSFGGGLAEKGGLVDLGEVVVFCGEPKDGHVRGAGDAGGFGGAGDGGGGLEQREEGATE